ncbi:ATP-binding protein [Caulobacter sp. S45]|uniref:ATP-binding protein n=1 Tax=Caulobacter sp. S45 TaxID=1641861 RepID=UPI00131DD2A6|nr:ATP-binding protein [Caulobacter sp. S45]
MKASLLRNFLIGLGLASLVSTVLASVIAFNAFKHELEHRQVEYLGHYVQERAHNIGHRFSTLTTLQTTAGEELRRRVAQMPDKEVEHAFDSVFQLQPDGTRRSVASSFDGRFGVHGRLIYGMGAFLPPNSAQTIEQKRILLSAFDVVANFGQAARGDYDNFYFFTNHNQVVLFGPNRPDKLMFYRRDAKPTLDFSKEEMVKIVQPSADPTGQTRCTKLQRLIQDNGGDRVATGCLTPVYLDGRMIGAFGSSINVTSYLASVVGDTLPGAKSIIIRSDGSLIAYPGFSKPGVASELTVNQYERQLKLKAVAESVSRQPKPFGVINSPDHKQIIAYGRLDGPNWILLLSYPATAIASSAALSASWILVLGLIFSALQTAGVVWMARRAIVRPLQRLALSCTADVEQVERSEVIKLEGRKDEIGILASSLRAERERADDLLSTLERRVQDRTADLEQANAAKSRFLANMSHELRTPLNGVIAISEILAKEQTSPRNAELSQLIVSSGRLLQQVLTDILDFSKIDAGEMQLESAPFDLETTIFRVAELHHASAEAKGVQLAWTLEPAAAGAYRGDSVRLTQVLSNLLSNAVKFTATGQVELTVAALDDGSVRFEVSDTGIGFDEEVKARLFQRFEQADASIRRRFGGTGLGLAICRSLVELMGGRIWAQSTPGEGSRFTFDLPLPHDLQPAGFAAEPEEEVDIEGLHILLAEDHPTNQRVVQLIMDAAGVDLTTVDDGQAALDMLEVRTFDVVLMDMQMPVLDGISATSLLRQREQALGLARTPVLMLTANALQEHVDASLAAGADGHLTKPIRAMELLETIAHFAGRREKRPETEPGLSALRA